MLCKGQGHELRFQQAFDFTFEYLQAFGAKIAPSNSFVFSSDLASRQWLATVKVVKVVQEFRDVEGHLAISATIVLRP